MVRKCRRRRDFEQETLVDVSLSLTVNGKAVTATVDPRTLLVQFLREKLQLTGTHVGCDTAQCGACTVHLNGRAIKSCSLLALQAQGGAVTTIEGLAKDGELHPMQAAFRECHGLQCGFCTPGMVMSAVQLLADNPKADEAAIREVFEETGLRVRVKELAYASESYDGAEHFLNVTFLVTLRKAEHHTDRSGLGGDHVVEVAWVPLEEIARRITIGVVRKPLLAYLRGALPRRFAGFHEAGVTIEWPADSE